MTSLNYDTLVVQIDTIVNSLSVLKKEIGELKKAIDDVLIAFEGIKLIFNKKDKEYKVTKKEIENLQIREYILSKQYKELQSKLKYKRIKLKELEKKLIDEFLENYNEEVEEKRGLILPLIQDNSNKIEDTIGLFLNTIEDNDIIHLNKLYKTLLIINNLAFGVDIKKPISTTDIENLTFFREEDEIEKINKFEKSVEEKLDYLVNGDIARAIIKVPDFITYENFWDLILKHLTHLKDWIIRVNKQYYTLNDYTRNRLKKIVNGQLIQESTELTYSDSKVLYNLEDVDEIEIVDKDVYVTEQRKTREDALFKEMVKDTIKYNKERRQKIDDFLYEDLVEDIKKYNKKSEGAFFKYLNKSIYDFSRYQIFTKNNENYEDNCLVYAVKLGGMKEDKLYQLKTMVKNRMIPMSILDQICNTLKIRINLYRIQDNHRKKVYGEEYEEVYEIGLHNSHYFIYEITNNTSYSIKHYNDIKEEKNCNRIFNKQGNYYKQDDKHYIDSINLIELLLKNKDTLLEEIRLDNSTILDSQFYDKITNEEITNLEYNEGINCKEVIYEEKEDDNEYKNVFLDFETNTKLKNNRFNHKSYLCVAKYENNIKKSFSGEDCGLRFLSSLTSNTRIICHNASYDYRFLIQYLYNISEIPRGNHLICASGHFKSKFGKPIKVKIIDSYNLISVPLKDFSKIFNLKEEKEVMPYELYNEEGAIEKKFIDIDYVLKKYIKEEDKERFLDNIKKWDLRLGNTYNILKYSERYCEMDVELLSQGYNIFRKWMLEITNINIDNVLTMAGLADKHFQKRGCFEGCYNISGIPRLFIQRCVVGGRCMVANNEKKKFEDIRMQDFDAVSLYASAMNRLGYLKGKPKVIKDLSYNTIKNYDGYYVQIRILEDMKTRSFPLLSIKNKEGIRIFRNDIKNKDIYIDKIALEDLINFNKLKIENIQIIRGYYFNDGFNYKIQEEISKIFNERAKKKKEGNEIEVCYKLLMNSGYGKTIEKEHESNIKIFNNEEQFLSFFNSNYNYIQSFEKILDTNKVKVKYVNPINNHFNRAHIGISILSMSKRIMNEVMILAEENEIKIYYQDTDSMHISENDIILLSKLFKEKYKRELIGKSMGQFHSDFKLEDKTSYNKEKKNYDSCLEIHASKSIFLGKKSYIDELHGINKDSEDVIDYHIRLKGIPNSTILYTCNKLNIKPYQLYERLYNGEAISFDLTNGGNKANFKFESNYSIHTLKKFERIIKF